jgi:hypothetical protein
MGAKVEPHHIWKDSTRRCAVVLLWSIRHFLTWLWWSRSGLRFLLQPPQKHHLERQRLLRLSDSEHRLAGELKLERFQYSGSNDARKGFGTQRVVGVPYLRRGRNVDPT